MIAPKSLSPMALLFVSVCCMLSFNSVADARYDSDDEDRAGDNRDDRSSTRRGRELARDDDDWFRDRQYRDGSFPSGEVHDAVTANTRAAAARMMFRRAESVLAAGVRSAIREFENSKDYQEATSAEASAYRIYLDARRAALEKVMSNPRYQALISLSQDLDEQIDDRHLTRHVNPSEILAMAMVKLGYATEARAMEMDALRDDQATRQALGQFRQASNKVLVMQRAFDNNLRNDEQLVAARQSLEDARIAKVVAETYRRGASLAAGEALDFAYYLHRYDDRLYNNNYGYDYSYPYYRIRYTSGYRGY